MASPAKKLPSVSWSASPMTTAPTAVVASTRSRRIRVATTPNTAITSVSWTMFGKRSGSRSTRHGLIDSGTTRLMMPKTITRGGIASRVCRVSRGTGSHASPAAAAV
jgi:hypothetical protein